MERGGRHPARRVALQTLFEIDFNRGDPKETWTRGSFRAGLTEEAASFAWSIVEGVLENRKVLDAEIAALAPEWPIDQMAKIDKNVLRIALYELRITRDVQYVPSPTLQPTPGAKPVGDGSCGREVAGWRTKRRTSA